MLLYHKVMLSYTSATIATALRRCPFFQPLLNALVLLHAADNRLQRSSHIAWRIPRFELSPLSPKSLQLGARFVGIRNVLIIGVPERSYLSARLHCLILFAFLESWAHHPQVLPKWCWQSPDFCHLQGWGHVGSHPLFISQFSNLSTTSPSAVWRWQHLPGRPAPLHNLG